MFVELLIWKEEIFMVEIFLECTPRPAPRIRGSKKTFYNVKWYAEYLLQLKVQLEKQLPAYKSADEIELNVTFFKNKGTTSRAFGDIDNLLKGLFDAMNDLVFKDDSQIVKVTAQKVHTMTQGILVCIKYLGVATDNNDCAQN